METTDPYVPPIIKKVPDRITKTLQQTIRIHLGDLLTLPLLQLSYSHMQPIGWKDIRVPRRAPTRDTKSLNTGIALAIIYAMIAIPDVQLSQVTQWIIVFAVRCLEPCKMRMKIYLAGNWEHVSKSRLSQPFPFIVAYMDDKQCGHQETW